MSYRPIALPTGGLRARIVVHSAGAPPGRRGSRCVRALTDPIAPSWLCEAGSASKRAAQIASISETPRSSPLERAPPEQDRPYDVIQLSSQNTGHVARRLGAVVFVDVVDSVRLIQEDQEATIARWRAFINEVINDELPGRKGRMVKAQGDGMLLEFPTTVDAVECALSMQARIERSEAAITPERRIRLRMGVHLADVVADDMDLYGAGVNLAARLRDLGGPQEIVVSASVRDQLTNNLGLSIEDLGERLLKGIERPARAFRIWPLDANRPPIHGHFEHRNDRPRIAVLPFRNLTMGNDYFGDVIAEDVIRQLAHTTDMSVISRLSTAAFRDRDLDIRRVGDMLRARYVIAGSIHTAGSRLRLSTELTEAEAGHVIWSDQFEGPFSDLFDLQDRLAREISTRVVPKLRALELVRTQLKRPEDLTAYERMVCAIDHLHRSSAEDLDRAQALLESAIKLDPHYVPLYAWLARLHVLRVGQGFSTDIGRDTETAIRFCEQALERDASDSWALSVRGLVASYLNKDAEAAIAFYDRALLINPSAAPAWSWSTSAMAWLGRGQEAVARSNRAIELSPFDPHMFQFLSNAGVACAVAGQYEQAIRLCRESLRENRMFTAAHKILAVALALANRVPEARQVVMELLRLEPTLTVARFRARYPGTGAQVPLFCEALAEAGLPE